MPGITEQLRLLVTMDADSAIRGMENMERTAARRVGATEERLDRVGRTMERSGLVMLSAGGLMAAGMYNAGQSALELEDAIRGNERVFGDAIGIIDEYGQTSAENAGLSEQAFRQQSNVLGSMLTNLGFTQEEAAQTSADLAGVAADLAAAFGTEPQQAIEAIGSLLRGERDPIEQFGVSIKQVDVNARLMADGMADAEGDVRKNAEAVAALDLLLEQSGQHAGAFQESAASAAQVAKANFEDFKATLGEEVVPIIGGVAEGASGLMGTFGALDDAMGGSMSTLATWGTGLLLVGGGITTVVGKLINMRDVISGTKLAQFASNMGITAGKLGLVTAAVSAGVVVWGQYNQSLADALEGFEGMSEAMQQVGPYEGMRSHVEQLLELNPELHDTFQDLGISYQDLVLGIGGTQQDWDDLIAKTAELDVTAGDPLRSTLGKLRDEFKNTQENARELNTETGNLNENLGPLATYARDAATETGAFGESADTAEGYQRELNAVVDNANQAYSDAKRAFRDYIDEINGSVDTRLQLREDQRALYEALGELNGAQGNVNDTFSAAGIAADEAERRLWDYLGTVEDSLGPTATADEKTRAFEAALSLVEQESPKAQGAVDRMREALGLVGDKARNNTNPALEETKRRLDEVDGDYRINVHTRYSWDGSYSPDDSGRPLLQNPTSTRSGDTPPTGLPPLPSDKYSATAGVSPGGAGVTVGGGASTAAGQTIINIAPGLYGDQEVANAIERVSRTRELDIVVQSGVRR